MAELMNEVTREGHRDEGQEVPRSKVPESPKRRRERRKWRVPVWLTALLVAFTFLGTVLALNLNVLPAELLEIWDAQYQATDFTIIQFTTSFSGSDIVNIDIKVKNLDTLAAHDANVTVQLLNATGVLLLEQTQATGSVPADSEFSLPTFIFSQANLVANYQSAQIVVRQTS